MGGIEFAYFAILINILTFPKEQEKNNNNNSNNNNNNNNTTAVTIWHCLFGYFVLNKFSNQTDRQTDRMNEWMDGEKRSQGTYLLPIINKSLSI